MKKTDTTSLGYRMIDAMITQVKLNRSTELVTGSHKDEAYTGIFVPKNSKKDDDEKTGVTRVNNDKFIPGCHRHGSNVGVFIPANNK